MNRIIPILPCPSIKDQIAFYESLGFQTVSVYSRPNPYAVVRYGPIEIHFYGSKKTVPNENPQMCYIGAADVDRVYEAFINGVKEATGRIPRTGIPRISKIKDLADDRRFILTDTGGNTLFIGTPRSKLADPVFYRTIESEEYAERFEILYDLVYSKEDLHSAFRMLEKLFPSDLASIRLRELDLAKLLLVALDLRIQRESVLDPELHGKLQELLEANGRREGDWGKIAKRWNDLVHVE